jgi:hypothetical protein
MFAAKVTRRVSPLARRSTISHCSIAGTKRCGCSALRRKAFQTWAWLSTGVAPGGFTGEVNAVVNVKGMLKCDGGGGLGGGRDWSAV